MPPRVPARILIAKKSDADVIVALINRAYRVEAFFVSGDRIDRAEVEAYLCEGTFHLASDEQGPVACVYTRREGSSNGAESNAYLGLLSVHPRAQGRGLGRLLMETAEQYQRQLGCRRIELLVVDLREELPAFYRRFGYRIVGTRPFGDTPRLLRLASFLRMAKAL